MLKDTIRKVGLLALAFAWVQVGIASKALSPYCVVDLTSYTPSGNCPVVYLDDVPADGWSDDYKTDRIVFRLIPSGTFFESATRSVTISKPFYISIFEVTQAQYQNVTGTNPSHWRGAMRPVERVSWNQIRGSIGATYPESKDVDQDCFIGRLRVRTGWMTLDLPTEAQWEYASRAGSTSLYNNGGDSVADLELLGRYSGNREDGKGAYAQTAVVGSYLPNAWGIYDMHGNVWEWCLDWGGQPLSQDEAIDPTGLAQGTRRSLRGGCWNAEALYSWQVTRHSDYPNVQDDYGFRLVFDASDEQIQPPADDELFNDGVDVVAGVTWYYRLGNSGATIVKGTIPYGGELVVPETVDGHTVFALDSNLFQLNESVISVTVPETVKEIGTWVWDRASELKSVKLPSSLDKMGHSVFSSCTSLTNGVIPAGLTRIENDVFHTNAKLLSMVVPEGVTSMGRAVFCKCSSLKTVTFPESFASFDYTSESEMHMQFGYCTALEAAYFYGPVPANVMKSGLQLYGKIYYSKKYADAWAAIVPVARFGGYVEDLGQEPDPEPPVDEANDGVDEVDGVTWYYTLDENGAATIVKGAVPYAGDLTTPQKLDGHDVVALADSAFIDCEGLTSLVVSDGVVTIGSGAVARCANLVCAVLPDSATNIVESCFYECSKLADVRLPARLPQLPTFFFKGTAITSLVIPEGVTRLGHDVFLDCTSLESVTLPSTLTFIDWSGFQNASALKTIEFPEGFEGFGAWTLCDEEHAAFGYCRSLETAVFHGPLPTNFDASWLMKLGCKIYFPKAYAADWESVVTLASFGGYTEDLEIDPAPGPEGGDPAPGPEGGDPAPGPGGDDPVPGPGGDDPAPGPEGGDPAPGPGGDDPAPGPGGDDPAPGPEGGDPAPGPGGDEPAPGPDGDDPAPGPGPVVDPEPEPEPEPEPVPEPPTLSFEGEPAGTTISVVAYKGVEMKLPVAFGAVQSVKVSGLPSGITYKDGNLVGVPKTASRRVRKTGGYQAKKATFTVKSAEGKKKYFAEIAVVPRAGWCEGSFDGAVFADGLCAGPVQLKLGANGKASGRFTTVQGGKAVVVALKGAALAAYDEVAKTAAFDVVLKGGGLDGRSVRLAVGVNELGLGVVTGEGMTLVQNGWKAKRPDFPVLPAGRAALTVSCESGLVLKLGATGQVKVSGKVAGDDGTPVAVRGTALLVPTAMSGSGLEAETVVFVKPKKNLSRGLVEVVSLRLVGVAAAEAK